MAQFSSEIPSLSYKKLKHANEKSAKYIEIFFNAPCKQAEDAINKLLYTYERIDSEIREHIDQCKPCWDKLVNARWIIARNSPDMIALQSFLGDNFQYGVDASWKLVEDWNARERKTPDDIENFYESTQWYVYSLVLWEASGQRPKYVDMMKEFILQNSISSITDFGAGVGNDTLKLANFVKHIEAVEINSLCRSFLRYRTESIPCITIRENSDDAVGGGLLWAMDVMEHLINPIEVIGTLLEKCDFFVYDCEQDTASNGRHPFHFQHDIDKLEYELCNKGFSRIEFSDQMNVFRKG